MTEAQLGSALQQPDIHRLPGTHDRAGTEARQLAQLPGERVVIEKLIEGPHQLWHPQRAGDVGLSRAFVARGMTEPQRHRMQWRSASPTLGRHHGNADRVETTAERTAVRASRAA